MLVEKKENLKITGISSILEHFEKDAKNADIIKWIAGSFRSDCPHNIEFINLHYSDSISLKNLLIYRILKPLKPELVNPVFDKANKDSEKELEAIEKNCNLPVESAKTDAKKEVGAKKTDKLVKEADAKPAEVEKPKKDKKAKDSEEVPEEYIKLVNSQRLKRSNKGKQIDISTTKRNMLITAALPYVNNEPHLGNLIGAILSGDVFARYCRQMGHQTMYICGTDEYGTATETKALIEKKTPREICDHFSELHRKIYDQFEIDFDYFGRTSTEKHTEICQHIFNKDFEHGFIKEDTLEQLYCENCQRFLADRFVTGTCPNPGCGYDEASGDQCDKCQITFEGTELVKPKCFVCKGAVAKRTSKHYFFDLEKVDPELREFVLKTSNVKGVWTANSNSITSAWFKQGLRPRCITRDLKWGVKVPKEGFEEKCFYVWFDAPIGYVSITANFTDNWKSWWQNQDVELFQFMGKDNVPFHTILFPGILLGTRENWTLLKNISTTEYLNYEDKKFSKRNGIGIFGGDIEKMPFPIEIWRYYLISVRPEGADTQFKWADLQSKVNNDLLGNLGNFCHRILSFVYKKHNKKVPHFDEKLLKPFIN